MGIFMGYVSLPEGTAHLISRFELFHLIKKSTPRVLQSRIPKGGKRFSKSIYIFKNTTYLEPQTTS